MAGNNPKNEAESGEEVPEKILCLENNEVYRDIRKHILKEWRIDIKTDDPDLILCLTDGPATTDIEYTLGKLNVKSKYIVLLIQTKEIHAIKELASSAMDHYRDDNMDCAIDLGYTPERGVYKCEMNTEAERKLQEAFGIKSVKSKCIVLLIQTKEIHALKELASLAIDHYKDKNMECVIDLAYTSEASVYKCQINTEAERKLQEAFGIKYEMNEPFPVESSAKEQRGGMLEKSTKTGAKPDEEGQDIKVKKKTAPDGSSAKTRSNTPSNDLKDEKESGEEGQDNEKKILCPEENKDYGGVGERPLKERRNDIKTDVADPELPYTDGRLSCDFQGPMEKINEKVLCPEENKVYADVREHLLQEWRINIKADGPDLVLCYTDGRLTCDIQDTMEKLNVKSKYIVLLIQTKEKHALKELASSAMDHYRDDNMDCAIDLGYTPERGVYKCQMNTEAERKLRKAFENKPDNKQLSSKESTNKGNGNDRKSESEVITHQSKSEKVPEKLLFPEENKVYADVREHLLQEWRINIKADGPDLVLCYTDGRLTCDIQDTMEKLNVKSKYIVLLIQTKEKHALKELASSAMDHYRDDNMDCAIDLGYTPERGVYKCQMNMEAERKLRKAFGNKPDKQLSSKESTSKRSGKDRKSESEVTTHQPKSEKGVKTEDQRPTTKSSKCCIF